MHSFAFGPRLVRLRHFGRRVVQYYQRHGAVATFRRTALALGLGGDLIGYQLWTRLYATPSDADREAIRRHIAALGDRPLISVVMPVYNPPRPFLRQAIESVLEQIYPHWQLCIADDASTDPEIGRLLAEYAARDKRISLVTRDANGGIGAATNSALALAKGDFIAFMDHDDTLAELALYMVAAEIDRPGGADLVYTDEDKIDATGQYCHPFFKPEWNPDLFYGQNYINHLCVVRRRLIERLGGCRLGFEGSQDYELLLRVVESIPASRIRHIPMVLYHWRKVASSFSERSRGRAVSSSHRALSEHLARCGVGAAVSEAPGGNGQYLRVRYPLPERPPRVSVIIPTRDGLDMLRQCVDGLLHQTDYPDIEIIIVDNGSSDPATLAYLAEIGQGVARVLPYDAPFNYSAINNFAARHATGPLLALLNNDIKVIHPDWLREMVSQVLRPNVGAVGAKLYYANDTIQHAGVVLGMGGVAGHVHRMLPKDGTGNNNDINVVREVSCVTAACMVMHKEVFDAVGGFDEGLAVAFNDVDLCLKIRARGHRILWTAHAELYHLESASRGSDDSPAKRARFTSEALTMQERWRDALLVAGDPFYSPNLSLQNGCCDLAFPPRVEKPWLAAAAPARSPSSLPVTGECADRQRSAGGG
jgi:O-antigen biosynthesis protein